jgi:hypothetical protein
MSGGGKSNPGGAPPRWRVWWIDSSVIKYCEQISCADCKY